MKSFKIHIIIFTSLACIANFALTQTNNFVYSPPDIVIATKYNGAHIYVDAFKSSINDDIIRNKLQNQYNRLQWESLGVPSLVLTSQTTNANSTGSRGVLVTWSNNNTGFNVFIETLTDEYRSLLKEKIERQYSIVIDSTNQIKRLTSVNIECEIKLVCKVREIQNCR